MTDLTPAELDRIYPTRNLPAGPLRDVLGNAPTLLVLTRHFGCLFCQELLADVREAAAANPGFPRVVLVHQGPRALANAVLDHVWAEAPAIEDPDRTLYRALGVGRMRPWDVLRPRVIAQALRALRRGFRQTRSGGASVLQMPGAALVAGGRTLWQHHFDGPGDLPDWAAVTRRVTAPASQAPNAARSPT